jgi:putative PIN family toxin of toxin-antitoxin system
MLVVFDTNVIISGLYSKRGASYQLLRAAISGELPFVVSPLIALEYEAIIHEKIRNGFLKASESDYAKILDALFANAKKVEKTKQIRPVLPDLTDDKILECAITSGCTYIITFNKKHFPEAIVKPYGIKVITSGEFLEAWRKVL